MKCIRREMEADVVRYVEGLEDGWEPFTKVVCNGHTEATNLYQKEIDGVMKCPYIRTRRGYIFIQNGDYIITDADGTKHVVGSDKVWNRYEKKE